MISTPWLRVTDYDGNRTEPGIGASFKGMTLWRVEFHVTLADLYEPVMQTWLREVQKQLHSNGSIEITVLKG